MSLSEAVAGAGETGAGEPRPAMSRSEGWRLRRLARGSAGGGGGVGGVGCGWTGGGGL